LVKYSQPLAAADSIHEGSARRLRDGSLQGIARTKPSVGRIRSDRSFQLTTFETNDGAIVGEHWVTIINYDEDNMSDGVPEFARIQVPEKKVAVARKDNHIDISLTREELWNTARTTARLRASSLRT
jgi:hypothetical protein